MSSGSRFLTGLGLELAYFSGFARLRARQTGVAGVILRFERVRSAQSARFQPLKSSEITPEFLDRTIRALRRWKFEVVSIDEVCQRAGQPSFAPRFAALTFDGGYRDVMTHAYPVLSKHDVPFAVYVPTAFPDGLGEAWWLALEAVIARHDRISLMMGRTERHFDIGGLFERYQLYDFLSNWMQTLAPSDLKSAINDLCSRYSVDVAALTRDAAMTWDDLATLAADPRATIGSATVNYPVLANMKDADAQRDMTMGRAVIQAAVGRDRRHFAYPFGTRSSFNARHVQIAEEAGFASAVSAIPGLIKANSRSNLYALPRISWDGRRRSLRAMRVMLSGIKVGV